MSRHPRGGTRYLAIFSSLLLCSGCDKGYLPALCVQVRSVSLELLDLISFVVQQLEEGGASIKVRWSASKLLYLSKLHRRYT